MLGTSRERPWNLPSASWEHSKIRSSTPRQPRSVSEVIRADLVRKRMSLKSIFEAVKDASWLFQAMFRSCARRFLSAIELARIVNVPTCYLFVVRVFCEDSLFDLLLKAPRLNFRRLHVGSLFYTIFFVAILQVHLVYVYLYIYIYAYIYIYIYG